MQCVLNILKQLFTAAVSEAFPFIDSLNIIVVRSKAGFGDYQCNNAMGIAKKYKNQLSPGTTPEDVGKEIVRKLDSHSFKEVSVSKQGFISLVLSEHFLASNIRPLLKSPITYKIESNMSRCLVDFSSPNIAKEMHVGHLRSTILGDAICKTLEFIGFEVERRNHLGDWGTQFGMLIQYMKEEYPDFLESPVNLTELCSMYKKSKARFDCDPEFKRQAQLRVVDLQSGEAFATAAWKMFVQISESDFRQIYDCLNIKGLVSRGESYYNKYIPSMIDELKERNLVEVSDGALCFFAETGEKKESEVPLMIVKSDGGYGYDTTDLATAEYRLGPGENCQLIIYVTDLGQEVHFRKLFRAAEIIGWHHPPTTRMVHIGFGLVQGEDGKKFKTRSGDTVRLIELLDEAVERAKAEILSRWSKDPEYFSDSVEDAAKAIGFSAVKYFDLKQNRTTNYRFSYDAMLDPKGNTAVYLLYAYARICSIFRKAQVTAFDLDLDELVIVHPEERKLAVTILRFADLLEQFVEDFVIHRFCEFCYELSTQFSDFYRECRVIGSPEMRSRLILCEITRKTLETVFNLVGITPLEKI